jgi:hypothetical protein
MRFLYLEPAHDWTGDTVEERLRICAETLFAHHLINDRRFNQITTGITQRADRQRGLRLRNRRAVNESGRFDGTGR